MLHYWQKGFRVPANSSFAALIIVIVYVLLNYCRAQRMILNLHLERNNNIWIT